MTRFRFVSDQPSEYGVKRLCSGPQGLPVRLLRLADAGPSRSTPCGMPSSGRLITEIHQRSRTTYGAPRVHAELRRLDQRCGKKRVARLMAARRPGRRPCPRKWRRGRPTSLRPPIWSNRDFTATPARRDLGRRRHPVLDHGGLALLRRRHRPLLPTGRRLGHVELARRRSGHRRTAHGLPTPTARPAAHPSLATAGGLHLAGLRQPGRRARHHPSFGSTGDCYDNAAVESLWATLKRDSPGSTGVEPGHRGICCARRSSTTSRASTTPSASRSASGTVHQPTSNRLPWLSNSARETGSGGRPAR